MDAALANHPDRAGTRTDSARWRTPWSCALVALLLLTVGCAGSKPDPAAEGKVQVALGRDGSAASSPGLTVAALESGQSVFAIEGDEGASYNVTLTADQIADLLAGSTVMTEATGERGTEPVRISVQKEGKKKFLGVGW